MSHKDTVFRAILKSHRVLSSRAGPGPPWWYGSGARLTFSDETDTLEREEKRYLEYWTLNILQAGGIQKAQIRVVIMSRASLDLMMGSFGTSIQLSYWSRMISLRVAVRLVGAG